MKPFTNKISRYSMKTIYPYLMVTSMCLFGHLQAEVIELTMLCKMRPREDAEHVEKFRKLAGNPDLILPITEYYYKFPVRVLKFDVDQGLVIKFKMKVSDSKLTAELEGMKTIVINGIGHEFSIKNIDTTNWIIEEKVSKSKWNCNVEIQEGEKLKINITKAEK